MPKQTMWHGIDVSKYSELNWQFKFCNNDGIFYAMLVDKGAVKKVITAPSPVELLNRLPII